MVTVVQPDTIASELETEYVPLPEMAPPAAMNAAAVVCAAGSAALQAEITMFGGAVAVSGVVAGQVAGAVVAVLSIALYMLGVTALQAQRVAMLIAVVWL